MVHGVQKISPFFSLGVKSTQIWDSHVQIPFWYYSNTKEDLIWLKSVMNLDFYSENSMIVIIRTAATLSYLHSTVVLSLHN